MIFLVCVFSLVTTAARPTSEPVPAVVGTGTATSQIQTGQKLRVDGSEGVVTILDGDRA